MAARKRKAPTVEQINDDATNLTLHCTVFAEMHGIDRMLDVIAHIYQEYGKVAEDPIIKMAVEAARTFEGCDELANIN